MLFPSEIFLFVFLPTVLLIYYAFLRKTKYAKNIFLLIASLFFYAWGEPVYVYLMTAVIIYNWLFGILVDKFRDRKGLVRLFLFLMVLGNLSVLGYYKYSNFLISNIDRYFGTSIPIPNIVLPIGISFFTFQAMSYVVDVYRGHGKRQLNPLQVGLYISFFPQLIAGPIVRYETVAAEIEERHENLQDFTAGVTRFCIGLSKKVLIANNMANVADAAFDLLVVKNYQSSVAMAWLGAISYTLQIFFDFSGYSDMAIGLGRMFGFHFEENFNFPYVAKSISEFWRRWHMTLQTWFRDYVYFPLGGSRVGKVRMVFNLFVVWFLTGIWHGAWWTFIAWGLMYFVLITIEHFTGLSKNTKWWGHIYTLLFVILGWVIFRSPNLGSAVAYIKEMFGIGAQAVCDSAVWAYIGQNWIFYVAAILLCFPWFKKVSEKLGKYKAYHIVYALFILGVTFLSITYIINNAYNPFIYFNF